MEHHTLNYEASREVYETCKPMIAMKQCYTNIFHTIMYFRNKFVSGEWRIAYGYIKALEKHGIMARHCFIVNEAGEAIDPTLFTVTLQKDREHVSFYIFDSIKDYIEAVEKNDNTPDLISPLRKVEMRTSYPWAQEHGYILM